MHWNIEAVYQIHASYCVCVMLLLMIDPLKHVFLSSSLAHTHSLSPSLRVRLCVCLCRLNQFSRAVSSDAKYIKLLLLFGVLLLYSLSIFLSFSVGSFVCVSYALDCTTMHKPFTQNWIFCLCIIDWRAAAAAVVTTITDHDDDVQPLLSIRIGMRVDGKQENSHSLAPWLVSFSYIVSFWVFLSLSPSLCVCLCFDLIILL